jgi:hypothetical protein
MSTLAYDPREPESWPPQLVVGKRYRIVYKIGSQRFPRYSVLSYLDYDRFGRSLVFSGRPIAGNSGFRQRDILRIEEVGHDEPIVISKRTDH